MTTETNAQTPNLEYRSGECKCCDQLADKLTAAESDAKHVRQANENYRKENAIATARAEAAEAALEGANKERDEACDVALRKELERQYHMNAINRLAKHLDCFETSDTVIATAISRLAAAERDAGRYQWLRSFACINSDQTPWCVAWDDDSCKSSHPIYEAELDTAIDAALSASAESEDKGGVK